MTTVVYDHENKMISVDSRATSGSLIISDKAVKYAESGNQVWFFCGATCDNEKLMKLKHDEKPPVTPDCSAIMVEDGVAWLVSFNGDFCAHTKLNYNYAIGSGGDFALAALDHGKGSWEAVEYAKTRDTGTGGKVNTYYITSGKFVSS